jgi:hypothetical protein
MSCCGRKRIVQKASPTPRPTARGRPPVATRLEPAAPRSGQTSGQTATKAGAGKIRVQYLGGNNIQVRGTASGRAYAFSPRERTLWVDAADARVLLRTRFFRPADGG